MNGVNKDTKFTDIHVASGDVVKPCVISARKRSTNVNIVNGPFCGVN